MAQAEAVDGLWRAARGRLAPGTRVLDSTLSMCRDRSRALIGAVVPLVAPAEGISEGYALDPFARLLVDAAAHPGPSGRAVVCLGEEGTVGLLALDGPPRPVSD